MRALRSLAVKFLALAWILASSAYAGDELAWPPLIPSAPTDDGLLSFKDPARWVTDGPRARFEDGMVTLEGAGYLKLKSGILTKENIAPATRLLVDYFIEGGPVAGTELAMKGVPGGFRDKHPMWATVDTTWPTGRWVTCSYNLALCEWPGAEAVMFEPGDVALTLSLNPGGLTKAVKMRNARLVSDRFNVKHDWLAPYEPLAFTTEKDGTLRYTKSFTLVSLSDQPVTVEASTEGSAAAFRATLEPAQVVLPPHGTATVTLTAASTPGMKSLEHARVQIWFRESGKPETAQVRSFQIAAPGPGAAKARASLPKPKMPDARQIESAMQRELRMPSSQAHWMGQTVANQYNAAEEIGFETFRDRKTGQLLTDERFKSGILHTKIVSNIETLAAAYANTGKTEYATKIRDWFVLYARQVKEYPLGPPYTEATSALCPGNASYVQASCVVGPMMMALCRVWDSEAFSAEDRTLILRQFIQPRCLESMKINPGLNNQQDEINRMLFFAGVASGDPNLMAESLYGDHGLQAKINLAFAPDGSNEESIAACYHGVAVGVVADLVDNVRSTGIETGLSFDRLEKAKSLLGKLAMPNGQIPNRGDCPCPVGKVVANAPPQPSITFDDFGMSVLREGQGADAVYVALDHRPFAGSHNHTDKLSIFLYGAGHIFGCDDGSLYNIDAGNSKNVPDWAVRSQWGTHSLVHNTVSVDKKSQHPGGGHRLYFQGDDAPVRAVGAWTDTVFDGVRFERHLALRNGVLIVVDRLSSDTEHTFDLAHHSFGTIAADIPMETAKSLGSEPMYKLPPDVKRGMLPTGKTATFSWDQDGSLMQYQLFNQNPQPIELFTATGWANVAYQNVRQPAPFLLARKTGRTALFISVISFGATPVKVGALKPEPDRLTVPLPDGRIVFDFKGNRVSVD